jgi:hypothetical protein
LAVFHQCEAVSNGASTCDSGHLRALQKKPKLKFVDLETDGSSTQFKGRFNFFCLGGGKFDKDAYCGLQQRHCYTAPGHGGGPVDNAGKVAKDYLNNLCAFKRQSAYDYLTAYDRCVEGMKAPSEHKKAIKGTWGCNGELVFGRLTNGSDEQGRLGKIPQVPKFKGNVTTVQGCQKLFAFRDQVSFAELSAHAHMQIHYHMLCTHAHMYTRLQEHDSGTDVARISTRFMNCCCEECRAGNSAKCPSAKEFGDWNTVDIKYTKASKRSTTRGKGGMKCGVCHKTGELGLLL